MKAGQSFADLPTLARHLRSKLQDKPAALVYAYNGTGKTRLSMAFKDIGRAGDARDTLYFNAYTEDLFTWHNDLDADADRYLKLNVNSRLFAGLEELEMDNRIRPLLQRYVDFDFRIDTEKWEVRFSRGSGDDAEDGIKVSRGEERLFVWCFFLTILQLVLDGAEAYKWVKYIYIDDPVSSLDDNHIIALGNHLSELLHGADHRLPVVMSTHHALFFDVMFNELKSGRQQWGSPGLPKKRVKFNAYFLQPKRAGAGYELLDQPSELPFFHHVAILRELKAAADSGVLYTYHFNMLRSVLEKAAVFHGYKNFSACLPKNDEGADDTMLARYLNILSHGNYSLYEPREMGEDSKEVFRKVLSSFLERFPFNQALFEQPARVEANEDRTAGVAR